MTSPADEERERFEEWARTKNFDLSISTMTPQPWSYYTHFATKIAWDTWQARSAREGGKR